MDDFIEDMQSWHSTEPPGSVFADREAAEDPFAMTLPPGNSSVRVQFLRPT